MVVNKVRVIRYPHHAPKVLLYFKCVCFTYWRRFGVMVRFFPYGFLNSSRRVAAVILALTILLGVFVGSICSASADSILLSLMRTGARSRLSIVSSLPVLLLPLICSAIAVFLGHRWLLILIIFLKSFLIGYLCCYIISMLTYSGPLFAVFFLFSDLFSMPVLCWFWFRSISARELAFRAVVFTALVISGIVIFDCQFVSPFLASLLS